MQRRAPWRRSSAVVPVAPTLAASGAVRQSGTGTAAESAAAPPPPGTERIVRADGSVVHRMRRPDFLRVPQSMRPVDVPADYTPFPLPRYTEDTGFAPVRHDHVPDIDRASQRMAAAGAGGSGPEARRVSSAAAAGEDEEGEMLAIPPNERAYKSETAAEAVRRERRERTFESQRVAFAEGKRAAARVAFADPAADAEEAAGSLSAEPFAAEVSAQHREGDVRGYAYRETPIFADQRPAVSGAAAVSPRHLQYDVDPEGGSQIQRLRCRRTLPDLLDQLRDSTHQTATALHIGALSDIRHSLDQLTTSEVVTVLREVRAMLPAGPAALHFPVAFRIASATGHVGGTAMLIEVARLDEYLRFFQAVEDRFCAPAGAELAHTTNAPSSPVDMADTALQMEPALALETFVTMAHTQLLNTSAPFGNDTYDFSVDSDNVTAGVTSLVRAEEWPGWKLLQRAENAVLERGADVVFAAWSLSMLSEALGALVNMFATASNKHPPSTLLNALVEAVADRATAHVEAGAVVGMPADEARSIDAHLCFAAHAAAIAPVHNVRLMRAALAVRFPTSDVIEAASMFRPRPPFAVVRDTLRRAAGSATAADDKERAALAAATLTFLRRSANLTTAPAEAPPAAAAGADGGASRRTPTTAVAVGTAKGAIGLAVEHAAGSTTPKAVAAANELHLTERLLAPIALGHPWLNDDARADLFENATATGWEDVEAGRASSAAVLRGTDTADASVLAADAAADIALPPPTHPCAEFLDLAKVRRFGAEMAAPNVAHTNYTEAFIFHSSVYERGTGAVTAVVDSALRGGRKLLVVNTSTLVHLAAAEEAAKTAEQARTIAATIQLLLFELHHGRALLVTAADELELQTSRGTVDEANTLWDTAARIAQRMLLVRPSFVLGQHANPLMAHIKGYSPSRNKSPLDGNRTMAGTTLGRTRNELMALAVEGGVRFIGGNPRAESETSGRESGCRDPRGPRFDFRFATQRRAERWATFDSRNMFDKGQRVDARAQQRAVPGRSKGLDGQDLAYLGMHTPANPSV